MARRTGREFLEFWRTFTLRNRSALMRKEISILAPTVFRRWSLRALISASGRAHESQGRQDCAGAGRDAALLRACLEARKRSLAGSTWSAWASCRSSKSASHRTCVSSLARVSRLMSQPRRAAGHPGSPRSRRRAKSAARQKTWRTPFSADALGEVPVQIVNFQEIAVCDGDSVGEDDEVQPARVLGRGILDPSQRRHGMKGKNWL